MKGYIFLILLVLCLSCKSESSNRTGHAPQEKKPVLLDSSTELYRYFHSKPYSQMQKDENAIISYAGDRDLSLYRTKTGVYYRILKEGNGALIRQRKSAKLSVHYEGRMLDDKVFDSSYKRDKPIQFRIGEMIRGWNETLVYFREGTQAEMFIPSHLAYGTEGLENYIPPNSALIFKLDIVSVED